MSVVGLFVETLSAEVLSVVDLLVEAFSEEDLSVATLLVEALSEEALLVAAFLVEVFSAEVFSVVVLLVGAFSAAALLVGDLSVDTLLVAALSMEVEALSEEVLLVVSLLAAALSITAFLVVVLLEVSILVLTSSKRLVDKFIASAATDLTLVIIVSRTGRTLASISVLTFSSRALPEATGVCVSVFLVMDSFLVVFPSLFSIWFLEVFSDITDVTTSGVSAVMSSVGILRNFL